MAVVRRLSVPIPRDTRRQLQALADVQSCSLAAVCTELLVACGPEVYEMAQALKLAKQSPAGAKRKMAEALEQKLAEADQLMLKLDTTPKAVPRHKKTG